MASSATWMQDRPSLSRIAPAQHRRSSLSQQQQPPQLQQLSFFSPEATNPTLSPATPSLEQSSVHPIAAGDASTAAGLPALAALLDVVGTETRIPGPLFQLLSGIVAAVEVNAERTEALATQYSELAFEVATISRVISSNQLGEHNHSQNVQAKKKAVTSASAVNQSSAAAANDSATMQGTRRKGTAAAEDALAAESVAALHSHAVADLESRLDHLAQRIGALQEDAAMRTRDAMEQTYRSVLETCDAERARTAEALRATARTVESQFVVSLNDAFAHKEARLLETAQAAHIGLADAAQELSEAFTRAGAAFVHNASAAATATIATATRAAATIVIDAREAVAETAHDAAARTFETESRALWMFQRAERMFERVMKAASAAGSTSTSRGDDSLQLLSSSKSDSVPLPFRCCAAVEQVRALYAVLGIDGADALRVFRAHVETPSLMAEGDDAAGFALSRRVSESLKVVLRAPAFRCLQEALPPLGVQVTDTLPPTEGAEVVSLDPAGRAAQAGLRVGDVILRVDGVDVGPGAASRGGLHLALILARGRPLPHSVRAILADSKPAAAVASSNASRSAPSGAAAVRWAPELPRQDLLIVSTEFGSRTNVGVANRRQSEQHGAALTVYRVRDGLTFTTRLNLDP